MLAHPSLVFVSLVSCGALFHATSKETRRSSDASDEERGAIQERHLRRTFESCDRIKKEAQAQAQAVKGGVVWRIQTYDIRHELNSSLYSSSAAACNK